MKRLTAISILSSLLLFLGVALNAQEVTNVSIINLIATPERYHRKKVSVVGYAVIDFENVGIFLSESDAKLNISKNAIALAFTKKEMDKYHSLSNRYVIAEGIFDADFSGHGSMKSGSIKNFTRFEEW